MLSLGKWRPSAVGGLRVLTIGGAVQAQELLHAPFVLKPSRLHHGEQLPCPKLPVISSSSVCTTGASGAFSAIPATASTVCSARSIAPRARSSSSRRGMRKWRRSWPAAYAKFTGELGRLHRDLRPRRVAPDHRLYDARLDHMPVLAIAGQQARSGARRALPAGTRSGRDVQGRGRRLRRSRRSAPAQVRHLIDRAVRIAMARADGHRAGPPQRSAGCDLRGAAARSTARCIPASAISRRKSSPMHADLRARGRGAERRQEGRDPGRRRRAARQPTRSSPSPTGSAPASPRRCSARRCCPTICRGSPARSACSAPSRATT